MKMKKSIQNTVKRIACTACAVLSAAVFTFTLSANKYTEDVHQNAVVAEAASSVKVMTAPLQDYMVTSPYGWRTLEGERKFHTGVDFVSLTDKTDVYAVADGTIVLTNNSCPNKTNKSKGFGNYIVLKMKDGSIAIYAHLQPNIAVKAGQKVKAGDKIANYGTSGYALGAHLHLEMRPKQYSDVSNSVYTYYDHNGQKYSLNTNPTTSSGNIEYVHPRPTRQNILTDGATYKIKSAVGNLYMGTAGNKLTASANVQLANKSNATVFVAHYSRVTDAWYFVPVKNTALSLNCYASWVQSKTNINLYKTSKDDSSQCYIPTYNKNDKTYRLTVAQNRSVCLEVAGAASSARQGTNVRCFTACSDKTQKWAFVKVDNNTTGIISGAIEQAISLLP